MSCLISHLWLNMDVTYIRTKKKRKKCGLINLYSHFFVRTWIGCDSFPGPTLVKAATLIVYSVSYDSLDKTADNSSCAVSSTALLTASFARYCTLYPFSTPFSEPSGIGFHSTIMALESRWTKRKLVGAALGTKKKLNTTLFGIVS